MRGREMSDEKAYRICIVCGGKLVQETAPFEPNIVKVTYVREKSLSKMICERCGLRYAIRQAH